MSVPQLAVPLQSQVTARSTAERRYFAVVLAVLVLLGVAVRLYRVEYSLNGDEIFSYKAAAGTLPHALRVSIDDRTHPPLHILLLHFWLAAFPSPSSVRIPSILFSGAALVVFYLVAIPFLTPVWALFVVAVAAFSPYFVYYGQEGRPYALILLCGLLTVYFALRVEQSPGRMRSAALWALSCALLMYCQYIGILLIIPEVVYVWLSNGRAKWSAIMWAAGGTLSIIPWLLVVGTGLTPAGLSARIGWIARPQLLDFPAYYSEVFAFWGGGGHRLLHAIPLAIALVACTGLLASRKEVRRDLVLIASLACVPPLTIFILSRYGPNSFWVSRQLIVSGACFVLLFAAGLARLPRAVAAPLALALVILGVAAQTRAGFTLPEPPWKAVAAAIRSRSPEADVVTEEGFVLAPMLFYLPQHVWYVGEPGKLDYYLAGFPTGVPHDWQLAYACRPQFLRCGQLENIERNFSYRMVAQQSFNGVTVYYLGRTR